MLQIYRNLVIGTERDCIFVQRDDWAMIHACKSPCHQRALGYSGSLSKNHPNYLVCERGNHLFLNIIDPDEPLFMPLLFVASLDFIEKHVSERRVIIHCNEGLSRSPSLALLYLAKRANVISDESYVSAARDFIKLFPAYRPGRGIALYLEAHWTEFT